MGKQADEIFDENETKRRFEAALRGARAAGPQPTPADPKKPKESKPETKKPGR